MTVSVSSRNLSQVSVSEITVSTTSLAFDDPPHAEHIQYVPNTSSTGSSGCSQVDRFSKHFEKCRNREGHVKASVFLPGVLTLVSCSIVAVNLQVFFSLIETVL